MADCGFTIPTLGNRRGCAKTLPLHSAQEGYTIWCNRWKVFIAFNLRDFVKEQAMPALSNPIPSSAPGETKPILVSPVTPPPRKKTYIRWSGLLLSGALLATVAWYGSRSTPAQQPTLVVPTVKAELGSIQQIVRLAGQTATRQYANITAPMIRGREGSRPMVLLKLTPSGSIVKKGMTIASIDGQAVQDYLADIKDTVEAAQADVHKREAELQLDTENLQQSLVAAKASMDKAKLDNSASEVRTEVEQQLLTLASEEATARYQQLLGDTENKKKSHSANLKILNLTLERHKRRQNKYAVDLAKFELKSPIDGLLVYSSIWGGSTYRQIELGDQVTPGQPFMKVVNTSTMTVEATVNQAESDQFRIGQKATVTLDAFKGKSFPAAVYSITPIAVGGGRQNFFIRNVPIRIAISGSDPQLIPDLSAAADVVLGREEGNIVVPLSSVKLENGKGLVSIKTSTGFENREVKLGMRNDTHTSILAGLTQGDEIKALF